jgi:hypothetical protein
LEEGDARPAWSSTGDQGEQGRQDKCTACLELCYRAERGRRCRRAAPPPQPRPGRGSDQSSKQSVRLHSAPPNPVRVLSTWSCSGLKKNIKPGRASSHQEEEHQARKGRWWPLSPSQGQETPHLKRKRERPREQGGPGERAAGAAPRPATAHSDAAARHSTRARPRGSGSPCRDAPNGASLHHTHTHH